MKRRFSVFVIILVLLSNSFSAWSHDNYRYVCCNRSDQEKTPSVLEKIPYIGLIAGAYKLMQAWRQSKNTSPITSDSQNNLGNTPTPKVYGFEEAPKTIPAQHVVLNRIPPYSYTAIKEDAIELRIIYIDCEIGDTSHLERRINACQEIERACSDVTKTYTLSNHGVQLLAQCGYRASSYRAFHGNQLQQALHQECIDIIERTAALQPGSHLCDYRHALIDLADSAHTYNQAGLVSHASSILSFCRTLLDYGKAIIEGAVLGATAAVQDIIEHPIQAALCIVAGEYVLAYQLSKLVFNVTELGMLYIINPAKASEKYDAYMAPLNQLIDAIEKKEITMRDMVKGGTAFAVGWKAQNKMLGGLNKMCKIARTKAFEFAKNNPGLSPDQYMATPEGFLLKATHKLENPTILKKELDASAQIPANITKAVLDEAAINKSVQWAMHGNKLKHVFGNHEHGFQNLVNICGDEQTVLLKILNALAKSGSLPLTGKFENVEVCIEGYKIMTRGVVHEGTVKIGTMYIPAFFRRKGQS